MKKIININKMKLFSKEKDSWCRYACMQMLLGFKGITCFDQKKFSKVHKCGSDKNEKNTSCFINNLNLILQGIIDYRSDFDLTINDIKNYILNDNPVCIILYLNRNDDCGHSYIVYGFDDYNGLFYIVDPNTASKREMLYSDFDLYFNVNSQSHLFKEIFIIR